MEFDEYVVDLNVDCKCGCMDVGRFHKIYHFPNDLGASVVGNRVKPNEERAYKVMLLKFSGPETYENVSVEGFDSRVIDCKNWKMTTDVLSRLKSL